MNLELSLSKKKNSNPESNKKKNFKILSQNSKISQILKEFLNQVIKSNQTHSYWLNTLAFLEHIGSRKILKSQDSTTMSLMTLEHIAEETRHAYFFKKLSHKVNKTEICHTFEERFMIEGKKGEKYFQFIDHFVEEHLQDLMLENQKLARLVNYLYTTWLIERRALWIYEIYSEILKEKNFHFHLKPVLLDENKHLQLMEHLLEKKDPDFLKRSQPFILMEETQFNFFLKAIHFFIFQRIPNSKKIN